MLWLLLAAGALGSCTVPPLSLGVFARDGAIWFTTEVKLRYFFIPYRPRGQIERLEVWTGDRWLWRVRSQLGRVIELPVRYGEVPLGADQITKALPLERGRTYRLEVGSVASINAFRIEQSGKVVGLRIDHAPDPDLIAEQRRTLQRVPDLMRTGMSRAEAEAAFDAEQKLGVRY